MLISDASAPPLAELRPLKPTRTATFPVYRDLADHLAAAQTHPDDVVAHALGTCAGYAYAKAETVSMIMARLGLEDNRCRMVEQSVDAMFIRSTAFLVQSADGRVVVLAYRGTEPANAINWLTDANVHPDAVAIPFTGGTATCAVHEGFYRNVRSTRYEVVTALHNALEGRPVTAEANRALQPMEALYITGHSLGGAMSALMAVMLVTDPAYAEIAARLRAVYTYGQPMIGNKALADACSADPILGHRVLRYVYRHDVVPHLPPRDSGEFTHFGDEYGFDGEWPWRRRPEPSSQMGSVLGILEAPVAFLARQFERWRDVPFRYSFDDHAPQHYVSRLTPPGRPTEFGDYVLVD